MSKQIRITSLSEKTKENLKWLVKYTLENKPMLIVLYLFIFWIFYSLLLFSYRYI